MACVLCTKCFVRLILNPGQEDIRPISIFRLVKTLLLPPNFLQSFFFLAFSFSDCLKFLICLRFYLPIFLLSFSRILYSACHSYSRVSFLPLVVVTFAAVSVTCPA